MNVNLLMACFGIARFTAFVGAIVSIITLFIAMLICFNETVAVIAYVSGLLAVIGCGVMLIINYVDSPEVKNKC